MSKIFTNTHNPILPVQYHIPDGEAHVMPDGKLYIYGSYDAQDGTYCSREYYPVSTADMEHWELHEVSFSSDGAPWLNDPNAPKYPGGVDWANPTPFIVKMLEIWSKNPNAGEKEKEAQAQPEFPADYLYAPDAIEKNGKYYLYFCLADNSEGVAVADHPAGPFDNAVQLPVGGIDPAVFVDNDGQAYYYWGQLNGHGGKLSEDMNHIVDDSIVYNLVTEQEHCFHEGSSMRRRGDYYYYIYADMERGKPSALGYAMSRSPLGPFEYKGIIIDNDGCNPGNWNNHGSIEEFNGQWYVFYHRSSRGDQYWRRLCVEPIEFNEDGTINEVVMTSCGAGKPFAPGERLMAYHICQLTGTAYLRPVMPGDPHGAMDGECLTCISDGDRAVFRYVKNDRPWKKVHVMAAGSGIISIYFNGANAGSIVITDGQANTVDICGEDGVTEVVLKFDNVDGLEFYSMVLD